MEPSRVRSIVAFSAAATLLYTPLFKKLTGVKNATVATVIALAPLAGALAAGAVRMGGIAACTLDEGGTVERGG
jgi:4-hydroxybenzoate polyprenyltransferase